MAGICSGWHGVTWVACGIWHMPAICSGLQWVAYATHMPVRHMLHICMGRIYVAYADAELEGFEAGR